jgi:TolB-like protein
METVTADLNGTLALEVVGREAVSELRRLIGTGALEPWSADETLALEMARRAAAAWLITGAYRRVGDNVRVTAKLIDVAEGTIVQTVKLDGDQKDILALEDLIVPELAARIRGAARREGASGQESASPDPVGTGIEGGG